MIGYTGESASADSSCSFMRVKRNGAAPSAKTAERRVGVADMIGYTGESASADSACSFIRIKRNAALLWKILGPIFD
jgi:hypothetical protein